MPLALYRRHRRDSKPGHPEGLRTSEYDERKKGWKRCECPIFTSWTLQGRFKRQNTGQWEWSSAQPIARQWEDSGVWDQHCPAPRPTLGVDAARERPRIAEATQDFLAKATNRGLTKSTLKKYGTFTRQLRLGGGASAVALLVQRGDEILVFKYARESKENDRLRQEHQTLTETRHELIVSAKELLSFPDGNIFFRRCHSPDGGRRTGMGRERIQNGSR